jgi:hypothetical protein
MSYPADVGALHKWKEIVVLKRDNFSQPVFQAVLRALKLHHARAIVLEPRPPAMGSIIMRAQFTVFAIGRQITDKDVEASKFRLARRSLNHQRHASVRPLAVQFNNQGQAHGSAKMSDA